MKFSFVIAALALLWVLAHTVSNASSRSIEEIKTSRDKETELLKSSGLKP